MHYFFLRSPLKPLFSSQAELDDLSVFLSSPDFRDTVQDYKNGNLSPKKLEKFLLSQTKYELRSRFRCTPFGTFAGISAGKLESNTQGFVHKGIQQHHLSLDMAVLGKWVEKLHAVDGFLDVLTFYPNNTLYQLGHDKRYLQSYFEENTIKYAVSSIEWNEYLEQIIEFSKAGKKIGEIALELIDEEITFEEAKEFILELIDAQILISDITLKVTGEPFEDTLRTKLEFYLKNNPQLKQIDNYEFIAQSYQLLTELKTYYQENQPTSSKLLAFSEKIKSLDIPFKLNSLFQMDTVLAITESTLSDGIKEEVEKSIELLHFLHEFQEAPILVEFKEAFESRYETAEVPLMQVLDPETGLGFPIRRQTSNDNSPLLRTIPLNRAGGQRQADFKTTKWSSFLQKKLIEALQNKQSVIRLTEEELANEVDFDPRSKKTDTSIQHKNIKPLPFSYSSMISILAPSVEAINEGNYQIVYKGSNGSSAVNLLGRFCHADDKTFEYAKDCVEQEEQLSDKIFAEIVHIPEARMGNVIARPQLRTYEIPIGIRTSDNAKQIPLEDIVVSIRQGKIKLRSLTYNKEIIPRMSNAHNYSMSEIPAYKFLCILQHQDTISGVSFDWGQFKSEPYLPRVEYGKVIFSPQKWGVYLKETGIAKKDNTVIALKKLRAYFKSKNIPLRLTFGHGDNILPLFVEDDANLTLFLQELRKTEYFIIKEMLYNEENLFIKDENGQGYTNEFILTHLRPTKNKSQLQREQSIKENTISIQRDFVIGSEWIYFKIYCGVSTADTLLLEQLFPLAATLKKEGIITEWFFIRYADPDTHIRIRFKGNGDFYKHVIESVYQCLNEFIANKVVWKVQIDTYQREIERYGAKNIENSESLFYKESNLISKLLSFINEDDDLRWKVAFLTVDNILNNFGLATPEKKSLMQVLENGFLKEFGIDSPNQAKILAKNYRLKRAIIEECIENDVVLSEIKEMLMVYTSEVQENVAYIHQLSAQKELGVDTLNLLGSYIHMFLNRYFRANQRKHECVIYYMLAQYYRSLDAREVKKITI